MQPTFTCQAAGNNQGTMRSLHSTSMKARCKGTLRPQAQTATSADSARPAAPERSNPRRSRRAPGGGGVALNVPVTLEKVPGEQSAQESELVAPAGCPHHQRLRAFGRTRAARPIQRGPDCRFPGMSSAVRVIALVAVIEMRLSALGCRRSTAPGLRSRMSKENSAGSARTH